MSDMLRITGLATGIDTESMISKLIEVEQIRVDKVKQEKQYTEWKVEEYREITNLLRGLQDEYFNVLKLSTNLRSESAFAAFSATTQVSGVDTSAVTVEATGSASVGTHTLNNVSTAKKALWKSSSSVSGDMRGTPVTFGNLNQGDTFKLTLDGTTKTITLDNNVATAAASNDIASVKTALQNLVDDAFGTGNISITGNGDDSLTFEAIGHTLTINNASSTTAEDLGFIDGDSNILALNKSLKDLNFANSLTTSGGKVEFEINGVSFSFDETDTLQYVIDEVNSSSAGVTLSYSSFSDTFTLEAEKEGAVNDISFSDLSGTNLLSGALNLSQVQIGTDAQFTLDGVTTTRSSNTFVIDGIQYTLNSDYDPLGTESLDDIEIKINADADSVIDTLKGFVEKYNEVISKINTKVSEDKYYDYKPLTEAQKEEMSEDEIELWEEKAKSGILRSDSILENITRSMRRALYDSVEGVGISLYDIGIKSSSAHQDKGMLIIDESKLQEALENNLEDVIQLFTKQSDIDYDDKSNRSQRYAEEGLANRLYDILQDNIRTTRDVNGNKGILLEKAGIEGDLTQFDNLLYSEIEEHEDRINDLLDDLIQKEDYYYMMFARMESAISQMNSQSAWLMSQMGGAM